MKCLLPLLALLLALCACAGEDAAETAAPAPADYVGADQAAQAVLDSQEDAAGLTAMEGEARTDYLTDICGVEEGLWTEAAVYAASGVDAREVIVLRLAQADYAGTVAEALEAHRQARLGDFFGYAPEQAALLEEARVVTAEGYAALLACADPEGAEAALSAALNGETVTALAPAPTPDAAPEVLNPELDISDFEPFDPPNEFDMTLYDTSAILAAWESGEEEGLSEKDGAILARCREIFAGCITDGMTDFEKELALHDALLRGVRYDEAVYDRDTPQGLPDNTNPYGALVEGYAICLGYAASFQLLMDLAGVECITVVGASSRSTSDHAWNLVRLEGEWYGVDPTWNDPASWEDVPESDWDWTHHRHFNVTSDSLRQSNHQWDYLNVPEAEGTRFFWNGSGPLPR